MIEWIKYRLAVSRAIASSETTEKQNRARIIKEEEKFSEYQRSEFERGANGSSASILGAESRRDLVVAFLEGQILKGRRDIAEVHSQYLLREADALGVPRPDETEMWLPRRVDYYNPFDNSREIDERGELLSSLGIYTVRIAIRKELKDSFEPWKDRAAFFVGAAGLLIAILTLALRLLEVAVSRPVVPLPLPPSVTPPPAIAPPVAPSSAPGGATAPARGRTAIAPPVAPSSAPSTVTLPKGS